MVGLFFPLLGNSGFLIWSICLLIFLFRQCLCPVLGGMMCSQMGSVCSLVSNSGPGIFCRLDSRRSCGDGSFIPSWVMSNSLQGQIVCSWLRPSLAASLGASVRIWTDCQGVINKFYLLAWGNKKLKQNSSNADLWTWVLQSVEGLGRSLIQLRKVPAH